jgi:hypothetical protein
VFIEIRINAAVQFTDVNNLRRTIIALKIRESVDRQRQERALPVIVWFVGWSNQGEVGMFCSDFCRAARREQCVGEFFAAVGLRELPRGGIDQGEALHRGELRLTFAKDCDGGKRCRFGITRAAR